MKEVNEELLNESAKIQSDEYYTDFYQKLRKKIQKQLDGRERKDDSPDKDFFDRLVGLLVFLPDLFHLSVRLMLDKEVPMENKGLLIAAVAYTVMPIDIVPDFIPIIGYADDLIVVAYVLKEYFNTSDPRVERAFEKHWVGDTDVYELLIKILELADVSAKHFGKDVYAIIRSMFKKNSNFESLEKVDQEKTK